MSLSFDTQIIHFLWVYASNTNPIFSKSPQPIILMNNIIKSAELQVFESIKISDDVFLKPQTLFRLSVPVVGLAAHYQNVSSHTMQK